MQLDNTRITIRQRDYLEILDLALRVVRAHFGPLLAALAVGAAPLALLDALLLWRFRVDDLGIGLPLGYLLGTLALVGFQLPLAMAPMTLYLGKAVFAERPKASEVRRELWRSLPTLALLHVPLRVFFLHRPFLNHVLLLERNPLVTRDLGVRTVRQRAADLHRGYGFEVFGRGLLSTLVGAGLLLSMWLSLAAVVAVLSSQWAWDRSFSTVAFPILLWIVAGFFNVARFLEYLNLRIGCEGWDVELLLRAQRDRLLRELP